MKDISVCLFLLLLVCGSSPRAQDQSRDGAQVFPAPTDSLLRLGMQMYSEARYGDAIAFLLRAKADSGSAQARFYLGLSYSGLNEFRMAARHIDAAVRADSLNIGYRFRLALSLVQLGEIGKAQEQYERIVASDPYYVPALYNLGVLVFEQRDFKRAADLFLRVIERRSTDFLSFFYLGVSMAGLENPDSARVCYATSMTLNPSYVPAITNLASFHYDRKSYDEALRLYKLAIGLRPAAADLYYRSGLCYQQMQNWSAAKSNFLAASMFNPSRSDYAAQLGYAYFFLQQFDSSAIAYQKAILIDSLNSYHHLNLALAYSSVDSTDLAIREFQRAIDLRRPEELGRIYTQIGGVNFRKGRFRDALSSYQKAVSYDTQNREARFYLSITYDRLADRRNARQSFETFLSIAPKDTSLADWKQYAKKRIKDIDKRTRKQ